MYMIILKLSFDIFFTNMLVFNFVLHKIVFFLHFLFEVLVFSKCKNVIVEVYPEPEPSQEDYKNAVDL